MLLLLVIMLVIMLGLGSWFWLVLKLIQSHRLLREFGVSAIVLLTLPITMALAIFPVLALPTADLLSAELFTPVPWVMLCAVPHILLARWSADRLDRAGTSRVRPALQSINLSLIFTCFALLFVGLYWLVTQMTPGDIPLDLPPG
jgi:hypothetical protein